MFKSAIKKIALPLVASAALFSGNVMAEEGQWDISFGLKTNHLWHGFIVTDGVMAATSMAYTTADDKTTYGFWGGGSFNGEFKEFTYYAAHKFSDNLFVEIVNHGNHSGIINDPEREVDIFNYSSDPTKTGNFTDIGLGYTFDGDTPVSVYYAVIVQGIDKFENDEGELERSWTNYIEVSAPVWHGNNGESVNAFIGGAFSPVQDANFYYDKAAINNVGLTFKKEVKILDTTLPVSATAMWNPALNQGALQFSVDFL